MPRLDGPGPVWRKKYILSVAQRLRSGPPNENDKNSYFGSSSGDLRHLRRAHQLRVSRGRDRQQKIRIERQPPTTVVIAHTRRMLWSSFSSRDDEKCSAQFRGSASTMALRFTCLPASRWREHCNYASKRNKGLCAAQRTELAAK